ncbi:MAG: NAD-dependent epimerase/dehydratase family protein [Oscillospiraceae bacterium]|nr:NAD-dependent epimerase/dehydratase family protein [Oscillospiraceae bacterium]
MKQILVIGGTYFAGRVHSILTSRGEAQRTDLHLHLVNRGRHPLSGLPNISQYVCDRHEADRLPDLLPEGMVFDAVVDFCGYEPNDIAAIVKALPGRIKQYIFISTSSVYKNNGCTMKTEEADILSARDFNEGAVDDYVRKKCLLEVELRTICAEAGIPFTILRPAFIYGPFNYAPRESWYVQQICQGASIPVPQDADSAFSFVYVMDVADIVNLCIGDQRAFNQVFNLSSPEAQTYSSFMKVLEECADIPYQTYSVTVDQVLERSIPLPWPLDESLLYAGEKVTEVFGYHYTPFLTGMKKTWTVFKNVYTPR